MKCKKCKNDFILKEKNQYLFSNGQIDEETIIYCPICNAMHYGNVKTIKQKEI